MDNETSGDTSSPPKPAAQAPRRDKLASMAAMQEEQQSAPRRGKFAKLAAVKQASATNTTAATETAATTTASNNEKEMGFLQKRASQRDAVLKDLKQAEGLTWRLLELASSTCNALCDLEFDQEAVSKTSAEYRETLQQIHAKLTPHAHLVVPYQNHEVDGKKGEEQNNMYAARVEMRLAMERKEVLGELLRLEQEEKQQDSTTAAAGEPVIGETRKRPRED